MNKVQTDNDEKYLELKINLRAQALSDKNEIYVLDLFSGDGVLWQKVKEFTDKNIICVRVDAKEDKKGAYLKGDNMKFLNMDLSVFDIIDLDAYGYPVKQLDKIFKRKYKGTVIVTAIQSMIGVLPDKMLTEIGYTKTMINKCPSLFFKNGNEKLKAWLSLKGIDKIYGKADGRKNYFYFEMK